MIKTNDKMNETVKDTLKMRGDNMSLYAAKRIEELEEQVKNCSIPDVGQSLPDAEQCLKIKE